MNCSNSRGCGSGARLGRMGRTPIECACFSFGRLAADTRVTDRGLGVGRGNWKTIYRGKRRRKSTTTSAVSKGKTPPVSHKFWGEKQTYRLSAFSCKGFPLSPANFLPPPPRSKNVLYIIFLYHRTGLCERWKFACGTTSFSACRWFTFDVPHPLKPYRLPSPKFSSKLLVHLQ